MSLFKTILSALLLSILCSSCLTGDKSISGGPKDEQPPKLERIEKNRNKIILSFDENVSLNNTSDIVSNIYPKPDIQYNRNKIIIKLENENNAKQIIDFRNSIQDLNEGIVLPNFIYADNYGADTFNLSGRINYLFQDQKVFDNTYVVLYFDNFILNNQSDIYNYNFTKTNTEGYFNLQYIPEYQTGQLLIFSDKNNNQILDISDFAAISSPFKPEIKKDSIYYLSFLGNNFLRTEKNDYFTTSLYKNLNLYRLNHFNPSKEKIIKDTIYDFTLSDSIVLSQTKNLVSGQKIFQLNNSQNKILLDTHFFKAITTKEWLIKPIEKDTTIAITDIAGDTLYTCNLISDLRKSTINFRQSTINRLNYKGILFNDNYFKKIDPSEKDSINLFQGSYFFIMYEDANNNGFYDPADAISGKIGENIVYNLKVIDIGSAMDVEIMIE